MTGLLTSIGGTIVQFLMQGALGVGETYSLAALSGTVSSIGVGDVIGTFVLSGTFGMIGAKQAAAGFVRIGQIESSFIKYATRDIKNNGKSILKSIGKRDSKYMKEVIWKTAKGDMITGGIAFITDISYYWGQSIFGR